MKYESKFDKLTNAPVRNLISSLAIPTILTMLVSAVYNSADSFFVGKIDTQSVASIGIVFSVMAFLQAIGFFFGTGSGILLSTYLGEKDRKSAQICSNVAFFSAVLVGIVLCAAGLLFSDRLAVLLGATPSTLRLASDYLKIILCGAPFILPSFVLNNHLRYQGSAVYSMFGIVSGSLINIALDPLFIFKLRLGVRGAAYATIIGQLIGFAILLIGTRMGGNLRISIKCFKPSGRVYADIFKNGLPSLCRQGIGTLATISMNYACAPFGDAAIAGMSVYNRVMFIGMAIVIGYGQGYQPVCSFNNGAKKYSRVYDGYKFLVVITTVIISVLCVFGYAFADDLIRVFRDDNDVIRIGARALRYQCFALATTGVTVSSNMLMQSLKKAGKATIMALSRQGIFYIPLILILPRLLGETGIVVAQPIADVLSLILAVTLVSSILRELKAKAKSNNS